MISIQVFPAASLWIRNFKSALFLLVLATIFIVFLIQPQPVLAAEWKVFYKNNLHASHYDSKSVYKTDQDRTEVLVKLVYTIRGKENMINNRRRAGLSIKGFEDHDHIKFIFEIDCKEKTSRILRGDHYNRTGKVFRSFSTPNRPMADVSKDPGTDALYQTICP